MGLLRQRVEPLLCLWVNYAAHQRLISHVKEEKVTVKALDAMVTQYANFLKTFPPFHMAFAPTTTGFLCDDQALTDAVAISWRSRQSETQTPDL
jgi:hypothetical protein